MSELSIGVDVGEAIVADVEGGEAADAISSAARQDAEQLFSETDGAAGEIGGGGKKGGGGGAGEGGDGFSIDFGNASIDDSGDGSDDDLDEAAQEAADEAKDLVRSANSNPGMDALADLIDDEIDNQAEGMVDGNAPDLDALFGAIAQVHSTGTAQSCMTEGIKAAYDLLMEAYHAMSVHEALEGQGGFTTSEDEADDSVQ
jgi:hypothetical protein